MLLICQKLKSSLKEMAFKLLDRLLAISGDFNLLYVAHFLVCFLQSLLYSQYRPSLLVSTPELTPGATLEQKGHGDQYIFKI